MKHLSLAIFVSLLFASGNSTSDYNTYVVGEIVNEASIPVYVNSPSLQSGTWVKQVSSPMGRGNNYWQMFIVAADEYISGTVEISSAPGQHGVTLRISLRGGSGTFQISGSTPGLNVVNRGILPPRENHDQALLHGRLNIYDA